MEKDFHQIQNGYPHCPTLSRVVPIGGLTKGELLAQRHHNAILLNVAAEQLFASPHFTTAATPRACTTVELTVRDLGFPHGAISATINYTKAATLGLRLCPLELGPHFRLHDREFTLSPCHPFSLTQRATATWTGRDWTASPHPALLFGGDCHTLPGKIL